MIKNKISVITIGLIVLITASAVTYFISSLIKLPLPLIDDGVKIYDFNEQNRLMAQWENVRIFETIENQTVEVEETPVEVVQDDDFFTKFYEIDKSTFNTFINNNNTLIERGYDKLFLDDTKEGKAGIKTTKGDNVLAVDANNNILIVGVDVGGNRGRLAIIKNSRQIGLSVVEDLKYWEDITIHAKRENAILAVNASDYTWNITGNYATLQGMALRNGDLIRRPINRNNVIGFTKDGQMRIGGNLEGLYNASEYSPVLIRNGKAVYTANDNRASARTVIGQKENGDILILVVDGTRNTGATLSQVMEVMRKYNAVNAANLSGGINTVMWWNGNIINKPTNRETGVKLPTAWVIKRP